MLLDHDLTRYQLPMRAWADADPGIARRLGQAYRKRLDFLREIFRDLGFAGDDLEMRTRLFLGYHSWERSMFPTESKKSLLKLIPLRVELLTKK